jgi:hypothetical protein
LFDLVAHEVGHCLTLGHVGDGADGPWGVVPPNDVMAYSSDPANLTKCASTLDVEAFAVRMSRYVDVNRDGTVTSADRLEANDQEEIFGIEHAFQVQHPDDHYYASSTGSPLDCPQPDVALAPRARTDWTPAPAPAPVAPAAPATTGSYADRVGDAIVAMSDIVKVDVRLTPAAVEADVQVADLWPSTTLPSPISYSVVIDGRRFDSFVRFPGDNNPRTQDYATTDFLPDGTSAWDYATDTVSFRIPRAYLTSIASRPPYQVTAQTNFSVFAFLIFGVTDDYAPEPGTRINVGG